MLLLSIPTNQTKQFETKTNCIALWEFVVQFLQTFKGKRLIER
jgi:hypothetical protein